MQIKPSDGAAVAPLASTRPAAAAKLALESRARNVVLSLSGTVRALSAALTPELLDLRALALDTALTAEDRSALAKLSELSSAEQIDPGEVARLALDLSRYRARAEAPRAAQPALLQLPAFSPHDEAMARTILSSVALRGTALDRGFVRALLDPDQTPEHVADLAFLRRAVVALSPARDPVLDPGVSFVRREARTALARALATLALPRADLPEASTGAELGAALLRRRLPAVLARALDDAGSPSGKPSAQPNAARMPEDDAPLPAAAARVPLTRDDRALLGLLYAAARRRGQDPSAVDEVARALVRLRVLERADPSEQADPRVPANEGTTGDVDVADDAPGTLPAALARSYGSSSQLAARAGGTYRSLAPPSMTWSVAAAGAAEAAASAAAPPLNGAPALPAVSRPLDLAAALGLSSLVREVRADKLRSARSRLLARRGQIVRAIEAPVPSACEADADDPVLHDSLRRERARWRLLLSRRRRARMRGERRR